MLGGSSTYEKILREGREEGLRLGRLIGGRRYLLRAGVKKFGEPDAPALAAIKAIRDFDRFGDLAERMLDDDVRIWSVSLGGE